MKAELYEKETPVTVENFVNLAGKRFYDGLTFHRVIPDFVIQGGCPRGDGTGGPGYTIPCETSAGRQYHDRGVLSMAHRGKDTGGSQFFICMNRENTQHLDGVHTCFGRVIEGVDVIDDIRPGDLILSIRIVEVDLRTAPRLFVPTRSVPAASLQEPAGKSVFASTDRIRRRCCGVAPEVQKVVTIIAAAQLGLRRLFRIGRKQKLCRRPVLRYRGMTQVGDSARFP